MNKQLISSTTLFLTFSVVGFSFEKPTYSIVNTGQNTYYSNSSKMFFNPNEF
ncbi:hypothetical protein [Arcobacter sp. LA11]|uniref:hypothetical protein n=1 Tax=Arcobacter sp. LA11 TaxID=1898176 RepID=UPI001575F8C5|nr:hypothetical protein [Arcobacter sp. LA11]